MTDIQKDKLLALLESEFDIARDLVIKYENTPHHYKYSHKMMAVRDLIKKIKIILNEPRHTE